MRCKRCGKQTSVTTMSFFNTDILCMDCAEKEQAHPAYQRARRIESEAVKRGDWNFPGVGPPEDL